MQYLKVIIVAMCAVLTTQLSAQQVLGSCGTIVDDASIERILANKKTLAAAPMQRSGAERYVPVTFHFIADDNGNGYPREEQALEQLASLNTLYADQEFVFYIDEIRYKEDSRIYNEPASSAAEFQMRQARDNNAMDIWVTRLAESGSGTPGVTLGYYSPQNDWIVIRKDEFNGNSGTLGHEIGHFFSLLHPHQGWGCEPYDEDVHGNPVSSIWSPCISSLRVEFQNGTNCNNSGDFICDTPPDYNFGFGWGCTEYDAGTMDPNGDVVDPMEINVMAYFIGCAEYEFTNTQKNLIRVDYQSSSRSYLRTGYVPNRDTVLNDVNYNYPIEGEETAAYNYVEFDWDDVEGADQYLLIIDRFSSFTLTPKRYIVDESEFVLEDLEANRTYYWRVWPFNESQTGAGWGETESFLTGVSSGVIQIASVEDFSIFPNPVSNGTLTLALRSTESFEADIRVLDLAGRVVFNSRNQHVTAGGQWSFDIDTESYTNGLYVVQLVSESGVVTAKFSVQ